MNFKKLLGALAVSSALAAHAAPIVVNADSFNGSFSGGDADSLTAPVYYFGLNWTATSTYTDNEANPYGNVGVLGVGDFVTDKGFGTATMLGASNNVLGANASEGLGTTYGLVFEYSGLSGVVNAVIPQSATVLGIGAQYSAAGTIDFYADTSEDADGFFDDTKDVLLMTLKVLGSAGTVGNFSLFAEVTYALDNAFNIGGLDMGDIVGIQGVAGVANFNNAGPYPGVESTDPLTWERTSVLNGNMAFTVPEPGALALLGLGLAGLGLARRNKKAAS